MEQFLLQGFWAHFFRSHSFPCRSLLLSTTVLNDMYLCTYKAIVKLILKNVIKTHDSESRGQEEAGRTQQTSELFTRSTALKFVNALNKPP